MKPHCVISFRKPSGFSAAPCSTVAIVQLRLRRVFVCVSEEACHLVDGVMN